ncbi:hypothetical protein Pan181_43780 [Aeoliella mucimassa]|uniref:Uncharacterized protein n=1 Tax=Aeoliella mucimassa TaxID=2527972 RepID=A0A518ATU6_9BACT|nr:hypothetical protein Pan181_43780 [Aeoliella mucimassa]
MQLIAGKRFAIDTQRENRFPLDAFLEMGIYSRDETTGFIESAEIQFSHRWVNWESIIMLVAALVRVAMVGGEISRASGRITPCKSGQGGYTSTPYMRCETYRALSAGLFTQARYFACQAVVKFNRDAPSAGAARLRLILLPLRPCLPRRK